MIRSRMTGIMSALLLASATATAAATTDEDTLKSSAPWWEKVVVTIAGDGKAQSCTFESSLRPNAAQKCSVSGSQAALGKTSGSKEEFTRITFERRFSPTGKPDAGDLHPGDTFLGGQVMALAIDARGAVKACEIVAASGAMKPDYGCDEASAEKFEASTTKDPASARIGYMTIIVYGHSEHLV